MTEITNFEPSAPTAPPAPAAPTRDWFASVPNDWDGWLALEAQINESTTARNAFRDWMMNHLEADADQHKLGLGYFACGELDRALPCLEAGSDDLSRLLAGRAHQQQGRPAQAAEIFATLSTSPAVGIRSQLLLLGARLRLGDTDAMAAPIEALKSLGASAADIAYAEGLASECQGDHAGAIASWRLALQHDGDHADALFRLAYRLDLEGEDDEAIELYEQFIGGEVQPHVGALMNLGTLYEDRDDHRNARRIYELVHLNDPTNRRARRYLSDAEASLNQYYDESRERKVDKQNAVLRIPVTDFELSVRARNCLQRMNIHTLGDLVCRTESELLSFKNFGETSLQEVKDILGMKGLRLGMMPSPPPSQLPSGSVEADGSDANTMRIGDLDLSVRSRAALQTLGINTVGDLTRTSEATLLACKNFGQTSLDEIRTKLTSLGMDLPS